jgi:uncharacterized protein (DUF934 family)
MSALIRGGAIAADDWTTLDAETPLPGAGRVIVDLERWRTLRVEGVPAGLTIGVRLANTEDVDEVWPEIADRPLIALEFPAFGDGRAYTQARVLRDRCGFTGELRATGQAVVRDQLFGMRRCGFNAFVLRDDQDPQDCLKAFADFSTAYQPAADHIEPVWRRRSA